MPAEHGADERASEVSAEGICVPGRRGLRARLAPSQVARLGKLLLREALEISQVLGKSRRRGD
jgi:hypothetical protein